MLYKLKEGKPSGNKAWMRKQQPKDKIAPKINQRGLIKQRKKIESRYLCIVLRVIARNMHSKHEVIRTYGDKVMLWTRNAL